MAGGEPPAAIFFRAARERRGEAGAHPVWSGGIGGMRFLSGIESRSCLGTGIIAFVMFRGGSAVGGEALPSKSLFAARVRSRVFAGATSTHVRWLLCYLPMLRQVAF